MGTNKRYAAHYDRLMDERVLQRIASEFPLQTLTDRELRRDTLPVTRDPQPKPCRAWVRFSHMRSRSTLSWRCGTTSPAGSSSAWPTSGCGAGSGPTPSPLPTPARPERDSSRSALAEFLGLETSSNGQAGVTACRRDRRGCCRCGESSGVGTLAQGRLGRLVAPANLIDVVTRARLVLCTQSLARFLQYPG